MGLHDSVSASAGPVRAGPVESGFEGVLHVLGESRFHDKANADGHLSVRTRDAWIVHTDDGQVSINGGLRVHGAFHADS
ncbi:hypothetical protein [Kitasatospora sp. NPDC098663]|uniref:hypothetical protein n=1 Tax=Kitasatospora sp. NPDC098663 TaxID=3364096 RepID=UPI00382B54B4